MSFETFVKEIKDNNIKVFGIEQYYDGKLIHSFGDTTKGIYPLHSITKSILSLAVGICADKNIINLIFFIKHKHYNQFINNNRTFEISENKISDYGQQWSTTRMQTTN